MRHTVRGFCLALLLLLAGCRPSAPGGTALEERLAQEGRLLLLVPYGLPADKASRSVGFDLATLDDTPLYVRHRTDAADYLFVDGTGQIIRGGKRLGALARGGELVIDSAGSSLFLDGRVVLPDLADWELFWAGREERQPRVEDRFHPRIDFADGFMRHELANDECRIASGTWLLRQHGGGMPEDEEEARSYSVQRAVNPFSVRGRDGALSFGRDEWSGYLGEANMYLGVPPEGETVDWRTVPDDRDMLVVVGGLAGPQVAFGWFGAERGFALATRDGAGAWQVLQPYDGRRPPLTNWVRLGLGVRRGCLAEAWLDGRLVLRQELAQAVAGPFHLVSRGGMTEWDDVRVRSYPLPDPAWTPICIRSANFATKQRKSKSDPRQFGEWSRGQDAFRIGVARDAKLGLLRRITTFRPLLGDWRYDSVAYSGRLGEFPDGRYRFEVLPEKRDMPGTPDERVVAMVDATRSPEGWSVVNPRGPAFQVAGELSFRRVAADGWRLSVRQGDHWEKLSGPLPGPVFLRVNRISPPGVGTVSFPRPDHHAIQCRHLVSDLFESVPADWSWIEGQCRMAARWACQNQWNFLACSGTGVPFMVSKRRFEGDQTHEYFMSMRPVTPNDAGDASFHYDPTQDDNLRVFHEHYGWYNRRDLNFSFCCDGRNPLSGYAVVFGGEDNTVTRLYRQGKVMLETRDPMFLFPPGPDHQNIHWRWWKFTVHQRGGQIRVLLDGRPMFELIDPNPLPGGFIAFWTIRNGFSLAKVSSMAEQVVWQPDVLYVPSSRGSAAWQPLVADSVTVSPPSQTGMQTATLTTGTGFQAVRHTFDPPVSLAASPVLRVPLRLTDTVRLNAFIETSAGDYVLDLGAGLAGMKALATPANERGECFQLPTWSSARMVQRSLDCSFATDGELVCDVLAELAKHGVQGQEVVVRSLTLGRTGNADYALAGGDGYDLAGASYRLGTPVFGSRAERSASDE